MFNVLRPGVLISTVAAPFPFPKMAPIHLIPRITESQRLCPSPRPHHVLFTDILFLRPVFSQVTWGFCCLVGVLYISYDCTCPMSLCPVVTITNVTLIRSVMLLPQPLQCGITGACCPRWPSLLSATSQAAHMPHTAPDAQQSLACGRCHRRKHHQVPGHRAHTPLCTLHHRHTHIDRSPTCTDARCLLPSRGGPPLRKPPQMLSWARR